MTRETEQMRLQKDTEIKRITMAMQESEQTLNMRISELEVTLERYQNMTLKLESTVLELNTRLTQKEDVEKQLATWKAHHENMQSSK